MKRIFFLATLMIGSFTFINAQDFPDVDKSPLDISVWRTSRNAPPIAKVVYSRPMKKDRKVWDELVPYGQVWRTGANESTEVTFYKDVNFGGQEVKAGTYSLFTIPGEKEWTFILNENLNQWGSYQYDDSADVVRVKGTAGSNKKAVEAFSISWENQDDGSTHLILGWDDRHAKLVVK